MSFGLGAARAVFVLAELLAWKKTAFSIIAFSIIKWRPAQC
jgi:hypothetical protein